MAYNKNLLATFSVFAVVVVVGFALFQASGPSVTGFATVGADVTVQSVCVLSVDTSSVSFGAVGPTSTSAEQSVTLTNDGNAAQNVSVSGTTWSGAGTMNVSVTHYDTSSGVAYASQDVLSGTEAIVVLSQASTSSDPVYFKIQVPAGQAAGAYTQTITFTESC